MFTRPGIFRMNFIMTPMTSRRFPMFPAKAVLLGSIVSWKQARHGLIHVAFKRPSGLGDPKKC